MAVLGKIFTGLELEVLLILNLFLVNVVLERLLFNLHLDVLLLLGWQVLIGDFHGLTLLFEVAGVLEWGSSFEIGLESALHIWKFTLHARIPMVFDRIICSAFQNLRNLGPLIVNNSVHEEQNPLFFLAPADFLDHGVQVVVPALTALLSDTVGQVLGNQRPFLGPVALNELKYAPVFFCSPGSFDRIKFKFLLWPLLQIRLD